MQIVIDIPEEIYNSACATNNIWDMRMAGFVCSAIANGTPLPKGYGRLIDAEMYRREMLDSREFDFFKTLDMQPTIIEADKAEIEQVGNPDRLEGEVGESE